MRALLSRLGGRRPPHRSLLPASWEAVDAVAESRTIDEVLAGDADGITIRGVLDRDACQRIIAAVDAHGADVDEPSFGRVIPFPLNKVVDDRDVYLDSVCRADGWMREVFGLDVGEWLATLMGRHTSLPTGRFSEDGRAYLPGSFRIMEPGRGGLRAHTGNEFLRANQDRGMTVLDREVKIEDGLSYFLLLQASERGGALRLFDMLFDATPSEVFGSGFDSGMREDGALERFGFEDMDIRAGDLIVFRGGNIWHKVTDVEGSQPRVTFGGFASPRRDGSSLVFWS